MYRHFYIIILILFFSVPLKLWPQMDTTATQKAEFQSKSSSMLDFPIDYQAEDTIIIFIRQKREILIGKAKVAYQNIELTASYIEIDFAKNEVFAKGLPDSTGQISGFPVFKEGQDQFEANSMRYNFKTKKGLIRDVVTVQDGGFLHSSITKKHTKSVIDMKKGKYTTCDHEHPHFYIALTKARVIQNEKIVAGPAYLVIEDIPTPIAIPFGYFPFTKEKTSGILPPEIGDSRERGFFLKRGGYYWAGNNFFDLAIRGSIYTKGSWDIESKINYKVRYKFNGQLQAKLEKIVIGEKGSSDEISTDAYLLTWRHTQDPKANPNQRFGANVNLSSSSTNRYSTNTNDYVRNTITSDVSYQRPGTLFSLSANAKHVLNTIDTSVTLMLPTATLSMTKLTPFVRKNRVGKQRWYETVGISYNSTIQNSGKMHERDFFTNRMGDKFKYGVSHSASSSTSIKVLKHINIRPEVRYNERWYFDRLEKTLLQGTRPDSLPLDPPIRDTVIMDTVNGFYRVWDYNTSVSMSTTVYGMFKFHPKLPVEAIRVVHRPSIGFSYKPDFGDPKYGYVNVDTLPALTYNRYANGLFGSPAPGRSQAISFNLDNNLEMKIRTPRDTANSTKKITLFDAIGFNTSYNAAADSMHWSPLSFSARTRLFNLLNFSFTGSMDWYALDEVTQKRIDEFQYNLDKRLGRLTSAGLTANFSINSTTFSNKEGKGTETLEPTDYNYYYNYFDIPWSINVGYDYSYSKPTTDKRVIQTINLSGDFSVTKKWKINYSTGYDLDKKQISLTNLGITRDLHCWVMRFEWVPFGERQSYFFTIGVKSSILQDLKYDKRQDFYDTMR